MRAARLKLGNPLIQNRPLPRDLTVPPPRGPLAILADLIRSAAVVGTPSRPGSDIDAEGTPVAGCSGYQWPVTERFGQFLAQPLRTRRA